jgi:hypothetical protein
MTEKTDKRKMPKNPTDSRDFRELPLPRRPSYEKLLENIEKWANSSGLQKPT